MRGDVECVAKARKTWRVAEYEMSELVVKCSMLQLGKWAREVHKKG